MSFFCFFFFGGGGGISQLSIMVWPTVDPPTMFDLMQKQKTEAVAQRCSVKKRRFSEVSQNSQESTCVRHSFLIKLQLINFQMTALSYQSFLWNLQQLCGIFAAFEFYFIFIFKSKSLKTLQFAENWLN